MKALGASLFFAVVTSLTAQMAYLPPASPNTIVFAGADIAKELTNRVNVQQSPDAFGGAYVAPVKEYMPIFATATFPKGDHLYVWIHYRALALQTKTKLDGKVVEFPWNWDRNPLNFKWRLALNLPRSQIGGRLWFIIDKTFSEKSGVDAVIITTDADWAPTGFTPPGKTAQIRPSTPVNTMPDAANATTQLAGTVFDESDAPAAATVKIDWGRLSDAPIEPGIYSLNVFNLTRPDRVSGAAWQEGVRYMGPRFLRYHNGGLVRAWFDAEKGIWRRDLIKSVLAPACANDVSATATRMININTWPAEYDLNEDRRLDENRVDDFARMCADLVRLVNHDLGLKVKYWEVTNEKDFPYWRKVAPGLVPDVAALARLYNKAAAAMRAVDPTIKIGGPAACNPLPVEPLIEFAKLTRDQLDFLSFHNYASGINTESDQVIYQKAFKMADNTAAVVNALHRTIPDKFIEVHLNEYNICYSWTVPEPRMRNEKGAVFDALSLIAYAQIPGLTVANAWNEMDGVYGKLQGDGTRRPGAHVFHYFNDHLQGRMATSESDNESVIVFATAGGTRPDDRAFVIVNRSNGPRSVSLNLEGINLKTSKWMTASTSAEDQAAPREAKLQEALELVPHSVNFYWVTNPSARL